MPPLCKLGIRFDHTKGLFRAFLLGSGLKVGLNLGGDLFFCSSPNFGRKIELNLSEDLFFFALHLILGEKSDNICSSNSDLCSSQIFWSSWPPLFKILRKLLCSKRDLCDHKQCFQCRDDLWKVYVVTSTSCFCSDCNSSSCVRHCRWFWGASRINRPIVMVPRF